MRVRVLEMSQAAEARRAAAGLAAKLDLNQTDAGRVSIIAAEAASNLVKHSEGGELLISPLSEADARGVEVLALDSGPGIADVQAAMKDGHSTVGSPGTGLGAIQRLASTFDIHSEPGMGTVVLARVWSRNRVPSPAMEIGAVCEPVTGENVSGDAWSVRTAGGRTVFLVADGLGHGPGAAEASSAALALFEESELSSPGQLLEIIHAGLRSTRGAAVAIASIDHAAGQVIYAGVGNISGFLITPGASRAMVSYNGTAGHEVRKIQEFIYPWQAGAVLLLHSDGIATHWNLGSTPALLVRHPAILAGILYRDHSRKRDDVTVVAARLRTSA